MTRDATPPQSELERLYGPWAAERWGHLLRHFQLSRGFAFVLVLVPDAPAARMAAHELEVFLRGQGKRLERLEYETPEALRDHLAAQLLTGAQPGDTLGAVWASGVANRSDPRFDEWESAWRFAVARVNERRDVLVSRYASSTVVLVGARWLLETLREAAPDWWSIRSLVINLRRDPGLIVSRGGDRTLDLEPARRLLEDDSDDDLLDPAAVLDQADKLCGVSGEEKALIRLLTRAFNALMARDRYSEAEAVARNVLAIEQQIKEPLLEQAGSYGSIGKALLGQGRLEEAEKAFRTALEWLEAGGDSLTSRGITMYGLGCVLLDSGRLEEAEKAFRTALEWLEAGGDSLTNRGRTMHELGRVLLDSGRLEEAEKAFRTALEWLEAGGDSLTNRGITMYGLGRVLLDSGRLEEAEKAFRTALEWLEAGGDSLASRGRTMHELGCVLLDSGRLEEAEKAFIQAIDLGERGGDTRENIEISRRALADVLERRAKPTPEKPDTPPKARP